jgi:hypothetical protein
VSIRCAPVAHLREVDPKLRWRDCGDSFPSLAVNARPLSDVPAWLGHADIKMTIRYIHSVPAAADVALLAAAFAAADGTGDPLRVSDRVASVATERTERA